MRSRYKPHGTVRFLNRPPYRIMGHPITTGQRVPAISVIIRDATGCGDPDQSVAIFMDRPGDIVCQTILNGKCRPGIFGISTDPAVRSDPQGIINNLNIVDRVVCQTFFPGIGLPEVTIIPARTTFRAKPKSTVRRLRHGSDITLFHTGLP